MNTTVKLTTQGGNLYLPVDALREVCIALRERVSGLTVEAAHHVDPIVRHISARQLERTRDALAHLEVAERRANHAGL